MFVVCAEQTTGSVLGRMQFIARSAKKKKTQHRLYHTYNSDNNMQILKNILNDPIESLLAFMLGSIMLLVGCVFLRAAFYIVFNF